MKVAAASASMLAKSTAKFKQVDKRRLHVRFRYPLFFVQNIYP
jgi:hypothetical protein